MAQVVVRSRGFELVLAEVVLRLAAVLTAAAAMALLFGYNGFGLFPAASVPGAPADASLVVNERTTLSSAEGLASVRAVNDRLGPLERRSDVQAAAAPNRAVSLAEVSGPTEVTVSFWSPSAPQRWAWLLVRAVPAASVAAVLWLLAGVTASARRGDPFTRVNVRRLTAITVLTAVAGATGEWGASFVRRWLLDSSDIAGLVPVDFSLSFGFVGAVLVLGVVTEVWRRGVAMRSDLDGLV